MNDIILVRMGVARSLLVSTLQQENFTQICCSQQQSGYKPNNRNLIRTNTFSLSFICRNANICAMSTEFLPHPEVKHNKSSPLKTQSKQLKLESTLNVHFTCCTPQHFISDTAANPSFQTEQLSKRFDQTHFQLRRPMSKQQSSAHKFHFRPLRTVHFLTVRKSFASSGAARQVWKPTDPDDSEATRARLVVELGFQTCVNTRMNCASRAASFRCERIHNLYGAAERDARGFLAAEYLSLHSTSSATVRFPESVLHASLQKQDQSQMKNLQTPEIKLFKNICARGCVVRSKLETETSFQRATQKQRKRKFCPTQTSTVDALSSSQIGQKTQQPALRHVHPSTFRQLP